MDEEGLDHGRACGHENSAAQWLPNLQLWAVPSRERRHSLPPAGGGGRCNNTSVDVHQAALCSLNSSCMPHLHASRALWHTFQPGPGSPAGPFARQAAAPRPSSNSGCQAAIHRRLRRPCRCWRQLAALTCLTLLGCSASHAALPVPAAWRLPWHPAGPSSPACMLAHALRPHPTLRSHEQEAPQQWTVRGAGAQALAGCPLRLRPPVARCRTRRSGRRQRCCAPASARPSPRFLLPPAPSLGSNKHGRGRVSLDPSAASPLLLLLSTAQHRYRMPAPHPSDRPYPQQVKRVRCETSAAMVPKDKAIKRFIVSGDPRGRQGAAGGWPHSAPAPARPLAPTHPWPDCRPPACPAFPTPQRPVHLACRTPPPLLHSLLSSLSPPTPTPLPSPHRCHTAPTPSLRTPTPAAQVKNIVDASALRDISDASPLEGYALPKLHRKVYYSVSVRALRRYQRRSCGVQLARGSGGGGRRGQSACRRRPHRVRLA